MAILSYICLAGMSVLAVWKLYELIFDKVVSKRRFLKEQELLKLWVMFMADFIYTNDKEAVEYKSAPSETYNLLTSNFAKWIVEQAKKTTKE